MNTDIDVFVQYVLRRQNMHTWMKYSGVPGTTLVSLCWNYSSPRACIANATHHKLKTEWREENIFMRVDVAIAVSVVVFGSEMTCVRRGGRFVIVFKLYLLPSATEQISSAHIDWLLKISFRSSFEILDVNVDSSTNRAIFCWLSIWYSTLTNTLKKKVLITVQCTWFHWCTLHGVSSGDVEPQTDGSLENLTDLLFCTQTPTHAILFQFCFI